MSPGAAAITSSESGHQLTVTSQVTTWEAIKDADNSLSVVLLSSANAIFLGIKT